MQNRRSDVVGEIARDDRRPPLRQVGFKHARVDDFQVWRARQRRGQDGVDFDGNQPVGARQQMSRQRAAAGANLNDGGFAFRARSFDDPFQERLAFQEMLSKPPGQASALHFHVAAAQRDPKFA